MASWGILLDILILLSAALVLGVVAEQVRQSAILGYLVAGTLVGPNVLGLVSQARNVQAIAELGVALLLFTIGLEFSFRRLARMGRVALLGGSLQVVTTLAVGAFVSAGLGLGHRAAFAIGAIVALSSTACVVRLLVDRNALETVYGRNALGFLLLQDLAVIPLMLLLVIFAEGGTVIEATVSLGRTLLLGVALVATFIIVFNHLVPRALSTGPWSRNRELPILLAIVLALGSGYAAHAASLSPAIGAFLAGILLGESPFATQVRADVASLRTVLVTLFFSSIGMLGDPLWALGHWHLVLAVVVLIVTGKTVLVWAILRMLRFPAGVALASALCIAQVGEFSFVLAETARGNGPLIDENLFNLIVSATVATLFLTPFLVAAAPRSADLVTWLSDRLRSGPRRPTTLGSVGERDGKPDIFIIGFGPAGQSVATALYAQHKDRIAVIEMNPRTAAAAHRLDLPVYLGDATHREVLEHAGVAGARVIGITIPDPTGTRNVIHLCRDLAPDAAVLARSRYHTRRWELVLAGAREVVDEEELVGLRIAAMSRKFLLPADDESPRSAADA